MDDWITIQRWVNNAWETHAEDGDILISTYIESIDYTRNPPNVTFKDSVTGLWRIFSEDATNQSEPGGLGVVSVLGGTGTLEVLISRTANSFSSGTPAGTVGCANWDGFVDAAVNKSVRVQAHVGDDLRGPVDVDHLYRLDVLEDVRTDEEAGEETYILSRGSFSGSSGLPTHAVYVGVDWQADAAGLRLATGDLLFLQVDGSFYGTMIETTTGDIDVIQVTGVMGSATEGDRGVIRARNISSISAASIYENDIIAFGTGTYGTWSTANGTITSIETTDASSSGYTLRTVNGIIAGTLTSGGIIASAQSLLGKVELLNGLPSTALIRAGTTYGSSGTDKIILKGTSDLAGQVVINANNASGTLTGVAEVGDGSPITISSSTYSTLPSSLGGGAVGLVPYRIHGAASVPANGSTVLTDPASVTVEYYGRLINLATGSETPMAIRKRAIASPMGEWVTVTSNYNYAVSGRTVTITPKNGHSFDGWFEWEITPVAGELKCANTTAASDAAAADVHTGAFTFSVTPTG